jgi:hypothetical protein
MALDFKSDVLRAALLGFNKLVVESGHGGAGKIYLNASIKAEVFQC